MHFPAFEEMMYLFKGIIIFWVSKTRNILGGILYVCKIGLVTPRRFHARFSERSNKRASDFDVVVVVVVSEYNLSSGGGRVDRPGWSDVAFFRGFWKIEKENALLRVVSKK